ncbi:MAG TPA: serine/threonine-protein kinase [Thermoanaerobaculia bacterium]|nr:serine/threonine-protein kinase [Thermoanaerobaculia bacterium]
MSALSPEQWREIRRLAGELDELDGAAREARLAGVAPPVAAEVRALLAADDAALSHRLEAAVGHGAADWLAAQRAAAPEPGAGGDLAGSRLGVWRLERPLGRGGMAEVWAASRADGEYRQEVAVKLLKRGMDSDEIVARFRRERQILAQLVHPAIARLLDGGVAPDGRPYFVLERVDGEPITQWCAAHGAELRRRVELLLEVAAAVAAAHRQLVVHRDLKPANILVTPAGRVKLLDFGIAKLLAPDAGEAADATRTGVRLLTPAYAAPEQLRGEPVSTATDVYALGVLAYELFTGQLPHRRAGRDTATLTAADEPAIPRPSTAVLTATAAGSGDGMADPRARRRLARELAGDLDTIVLVALRPQPERRYGSVEAFAADLRNWLEERPIAARPDSVGYRFRSFVRRHSFGVSAALAILVALLGGLAATVWQAGRARANAVAAAAHAHRAERVKEFLIGLFEVADPDQSGLGSVTAAELLDQAGHRLSRELATEPAIQAELLTTVARIDRSLGRLDSAESLARAALASPAVAASDRHRGAALATLGSVLLAQGRLDEAERELAAGRELLGHDPAADELAVARVESDLAQVAFWRDDLDRARELEAGVWRTYRRLLGEENVLTAIHQRNLGVILYQQERLDEAEALMRASQATLVRELGADHPNVAQSYVNLAALLESRDRAKEAERLYRQALEIRRRHLGDAHPATGQSLQLLGVLLLEQRRYDEAEAAFREALALFRAVDPDHFEVGKALHGLAQVAAGRGRPAEAEPLFVRALALFRERLGEEHPFVWLTQAHLAREIARQGRLAPAEELLRESRERLAARLGEGSEPVAEVDRYLAEVRRARGEPAG